MLKKLSNLVEIPFKTELGLRQGFLTETYLIWVGQRSGRVWVTLHVFRLVTHRKDHLFQPGVFL